MVVMAVVAVVVATVRFLSEGEEDEQPEHDHAEASEEGDVVKLWHEEFSHTAFGVQPDNRTTPEEGC